jgi:hypothetical protein
MRRMCRLSRSMNFSFDRLAVLRSPKPAISDVSFRSSASLAKTDSSRVVGHSAATAAVRTRGRAPASADASGVGGAAFGDRHVLPLFMVRSAQRPGSQRRDRLRSLLHGPCFHCAQRGWAAFLGTRTSAARPRPSSKLSRRRRPSGYAAHTPCDDDSGGSPCIIVRETRSLLFFGMCRDAGTPRCRWQPLRQGGNARGTRVTQGFTVDGIPASESSSAGSSGPANAVVRVVEEDRPRLRQTQRRVAIGEVRGDDAAEREAEIARPVELRCTRPLAWKGRAPRWH